MTDSERLPQTLDELCDWIETHADAIYVQEQLHGKWDAYALTNLPPIRAIHHALRFIREARVPVYVHNHFVPPQASIAPSDDGLAKARGTSDTPESGVDASTPSKGEEE